MAVQIKMKKDALPTLNGTKHTVVIPIHLFLRKMDGMFAKNLVAFAKEKMFQCNV